MNRLIVSAVCVMNLLCLQGAWAKEEGSTQTLANSLKKAGDAAGAGLSGAGKAISQDVKKIDDGLGKTLKQGGKKIEKAVK